MTDVCQSVNAVVGVDCQHTLLLLSFGKLLVCLLFLTAWSAKYNQHIVPPYQVVHNFANQHIVLAELLVALVLMAAGTKCPLALYCGRDCAACESSICWCLGQTVPCQMH